MNENLSYDKKSLKTVLGKTADFNELAKDCVAFANAQGGDIDIGIENTDSLPPAGQTIPEDLESSIITRLSGLAHNLILSSEILTSTNGGSYIKLHIARSHGSVCATSSGKIYIRIGDQSQPVGPEDIPRLAAEKGCFNWEDAESKYKVEECDQEKLNHLLKKIRTSDRVSSFLKEKDNKELLSYYNLVSEDGSMLTNLGVLFIGKQVQRSRLPAAPIVQCIKYDQQGKKVNKWVWDDYRFSPEELINDIWEIVPEWTESTEITDGLFRRNIPAYPESVIRELLCNALVHRPYTIRGDIYINIYPNHIEIVNPGSLPLGVTTKNILHVTKKRNDHFASLFYVLHLMEREGSGYDMMYETLLAYGKDVPEVVEENDCVRVIIKRQVINQEAIQFADAADSVYHLTQKQKICLGLIALHESVTASFLISKLNLKDANELRSWIQKLLELGIVISTDTRSKAKEYRIAADILRKGQYKGRTSLKRIEPYRLRELILTDLSIHKKSKIADINKRIGEEISQRKIWLQLKKLVDEGLVRIIGQSRWTEYEMVESSI
ncbi:MAG: putative DNA binding domain-containing protein [Fibrobacter sp.]|nr:putative DNA binding domain-containing protein [Fibrobacter sp.]